jgi:deoxyribonuclease V
LIVSYQIQALREKQVEIGQNVVLKNDLPHPIQTIAGVDVSFTRFSKTGYAALVIFSYPELKEVEQVCVEAPLEIPYIPGYLGFREWPLVERCLQQAQIKPDMLVCDGQGLAHPRKAGLACHVGVESGLPSIGCAKSVLVGEYQEPGPQKGSRSDLVYNDEKLGEAVRTRTGVKPVFVSPGHRIDFSTASQFILELCPKYRLPNVIRAAHRTVNKFRVDQAPNRAKIEKSVELNTN